MKQCYMDSEWKSHSKLPPAGRNDLDLVIQQVMKEWDVRSESMTAYYVAVQKLEGKFEGLELVHIRIAKKRGGRHIGQIWFHSESS